MARHAQRAPTDAFRVGMKICGGFLRWRCYLSARLNVSSMKILFVFISVLLLDLAHVHDALSQEKIGWYKQESGTTEDLRSIQFFSPTNGWICGWQGNAYRTTDGGEHWTLFMPPLKYEYQYFMDEFTAFANGTTTDEKHSTIIRTTDMGQTWSEPDSYERELTAHPDMMHIRDTVFQLNDQNFLRSIDSGKTWEKFFSALSYSTTFAFTDSKNGVAAGQKIGSCQGPQQYGGFAFTQNGGEYWHPVETRLGHNLYDIFPIRGKLFVVGSEELIAVSTNKGVSWEKIPTIDNTNQVYKAITFSDDRNGTVVGSGGYVLRTTDGGMSWNRQESKVGQWLLSVTFVDSLRGWAVGNYGTIIHTTDAGKSWVQQYLPDPEWLNSYVSPQPFATKTTISYELPKAVRVTVRIYDGLGKELQTFSEPGVQDAGMHSVEFDGSAFSHEVFYYRIEAYPYVGTGKFSKVPF